MLSCSHISNELWYVWYGDSISCNHFRFGSVMCHFKEPLMRQKLRHACLCNVIVLSLSVQLCGTFNATAPTADMSDISHTGIWVWGRECLKSTKGWNVKVRFFSFCEPATKCNLINDYITPDLKDLKCSKGRWFEMSLLSGLYMVSNM